MKQKLLIQQFKSSKQSQPKMDTRYQTLLDELHTTKRELTNYRQKYLNIENELLALHQQNRTHKKTISSLKQTVEKLNDQNKTLLAEKQSILSEYSTSVESIKDEINKKQQQIFILKENTFSPFTNQKLIEKQLRCEIENQFEQQLEAKEKRNCELMQHNEKLIFDKAVEKEKYELKIQVLQKELKQMQNAHLIQLQGYATRTYQSSQSTKISEEQTLIKKLRRQIDELRSTLDSTQQQLHESINQKTKIQKQHSAFICKHKAEVEKYADEMRALQFDSEKYHQAASKGKPEKEQVFLKDKEREIKSLKDRIEELHQKMSKKDAKISQLEVDLVAKQNEIKKLKEFTHKHSSQKISELKTEKQSYRREINQLRLVNQNIRKQNIQLMSSISEINIKSTRNINQQSISQNKQSYLQNQQNTFIRQSLNKENYLSVHQNKSKPSIIDENEENHENHESQQVENYFGQLKKARSSTNLRASEISSKLELYKRQYEDECQKNKQLGVKYVELKKKYKHLEEKFNQANTKLMELLKDKIQLNSPTAASKKSFQFPTSPQPRYILSPEPESIQYSKTQGSLNPLRELHFSPEFTITKAKRAERSESQTKGDQSFYEKSLKIKNSHKFKQIKCLNHDDPRHDHAGCSHSPLK